MNIIHEISIDFQRPGVRPKIHIKENDLATRRIHILFFDGGEPYPVTVSTTTAVVCYAKSDGTSGVYDHIGEGDDAHQAYQFDSNGKGVTIEIAPSMANGFGLIRCEVRLVAADQILSTFTFDIEVERSVTSGTRADDYFSYRAFDQLYSEVDAASTHIDQIAEFDPDTTQEIVYSKADLDPEYSATYVNNGYIGSNGGFTASSDYRTYYMSFTAESDVWVERLQLASWYLSIAVYRAAPATGTFVARYRSGDGNLPTADNRLHIAPGYVVAVSYGYSTPDPGRDFRLYTGQYITIPGAVHATDAMATSVAKKIGADVRTVEKTAGRITVRIGSARFEVNRYDDNAIRAHLWRTNACYATDGEGVEHTVWKDSDSDGVVKISGESDFVGGYHGDETQTDIKIFVDGNEYGEESEIDNTPFDSITIICKSDVYHCNTSQTPDVVAFKRYKVIRFDADGYTVSNRWVAQAEIRCEISYCGMLSVEDAIADGFYTNSGNEFVAVGGTASRDTACTGVTFETSCGEIEMHVSGYTQPDTFGTAVSKYTARTKVYASNFNSSSQGLITSGGVIRGVANIRIRG